MGRYLEIETESGYTTTLSSKAGMPCDECGSPMHWPFGTALVFCPVCLEAFGMGGAFLKRVPVIVRVHERTPEEQANYEETQRAVHA
jgi:uncharacterized Zn finger protein (UPF0148 family)